jgi:hypothetical protein
MEIFFAIAKFLSGLCEKIFGKKKEEPKKQQNYDHIKPSIFNPPYPGGPPEPRPPFKSPTPLYPKPSRKLCGYRNRKTV